MPNLGFRDQQTEKATRLAKTDFFTENLEFSLEEKGGDDKFLLKNNKNSVQSLLYSFDKRLHKPFCFASDRHRMAPAASLSSSVENL